MYTITIANGFINIQDTVLDKLQSVQVTGVVFANEKEHVAIHAAGKTIMLHPTLIDTINGAAISDETIDEIIELIQACLAGTTLLPALTFTFANFTALPSDITDPTSLAQWNAKFSSNYTSISVVGYVVTLSGGSNVTLSGMDNLDNLLSVTDSGSVTSLDNAFLNCVSATSFNLPVLTNIGLNSFVNCVSVSSFSFPLVTTVGDYAFSGCLATSYNLPSCTNLGGTTGDDGVFDAIAGNTISLNVPSALMTCNSGNPDGDIQYLQTNNTVTVTTI